jgi:hypothetical protein
MSEEKFVFKSEIRNRLSIVAVVGLVLVAAGAAMLIFGGHPSDEAASSEGHHFHWLHRVWVNLWINNIYFLGIALTAVLFLALQYASQAGWSAYIKRIPEAFGGWIIVGFGLNRCHIWPGKLCRT